jgi:hypothetical protein
LWAQKEAGRLKLKQDDKMIKNSPNFSKSSQNSLLVKKAKDLHSTTFVTLKFLQKTCFETAYVGENAMN